LNIRTRQSEKESREKQSERMRERERERGETAQGMTLDYIVYPVSDISLSIY
jgi:hypothetical protein